MKYRIASSSSYLLSTVLLSCVLAVGGGSLTSCAASEDAVDGAAASSGGQIGAGGGTPVTSSGGQSSGGSSTSGGAGNATGAGGSTSGNPTATKFSFFMASQAGMTRLAGNAKGFGGDLRFGKVDGLTGADEICRQLAETSLPGNGKTWRAFLSVTKGPDGAAVNAIDRIGEGPWYDRLGRVFAMNKAALLNSRPQGADPSIINDFPNEEGVPNHDPGTGIIDNHNVLTGSSTRGTVDSQGMRATCQDWTSAASGSGSPRCGVSWPRANLIHWMSTLNEGGCMPGTTPANGADSGPAGTVGALGGYGGIYCFALTP